ncbi:MAG: hypothetical protein IGS39_01640 [Calothrix sp. C42_A2020_038]|nr:hypothetical protein [Calothrix sp. C42_A2020_038]
MKIIKKSRESLILSKGNVVFNSLLVFAISVFLFPFASLLLIVPFIPLALHEELKGNTLNCNRLSHGQIQCQINERELIQIAGAKVAKEVFENEDSTTEYFQVKLFTNNDVELDFGYKKTSESEAKQISQQINNFISNYNQKSFSIVQPSEPITTIVAYLYNFLMINALAAVGIYGIIRLSQFTCKKTWYFDFEKRILIITTTSLIRVKHEKHFLVYLDYQELLYRKNNYYHIHLVKENGEKILLEFNSDLNTVNNISQIINELLGIKLEKISASIASKKDYWEFNLKQRNLDINGTIYNFSDINISVNKDEDDDIVSYDLIITVPSGKKLNFYSHYSQKLVYYQYNLVKSILALT